MPIGIMSASPVRLLGAAEKYPELISARDTVNHFVRFCNASGGTSASGGYR